MNKKGFIATSLLYTFFLLFCALLLSFAASLAQKSLLVNKEIGKINDDLHGVKAIKDVNTFTYFKLNTCVNNDYFQQENTFDYILIKNNEDKNQSTFISSTTTYKINNISTLNTLLKNINVQNNGNIYPSRSITLDDYDIIKDKKIAQLTSNYLIANNPDNNYTGSKYYIYSLDNRTGTLSENLINTEEIYLRLAFDLDPNIMILSGNGTIISPYILEGSSVECYIPKAESITLTPTSKTLKVGDNTEIYASILPTTITNENITWTSSNTVVATIENGKVLAKSAGTTTITAKTSNGKTATCKITVSKPTTAAEVCNYVKVNEIGKVTYKQFQEVVNIKNVKGDNTDDYYSIKAAHECANQLGVPVEAEKNGEYNIYKEKTDNSSILVRTSTNLNGATIYIHDETGILGTKDAKDNAKDREAIYAIKTGTGTNGKTIKTLTDPNFTVTTSTKKINAFAGYGDALVRIINSEKKHFIRKSVKNNDDGYDEQEILLVDDNGNIQNDILWDYDKITKAYIVDRNDETITFENGNFVTIADTSTTATTASAYAFRGIHVNRSNSEVKNINHTVVNSNKEEITTIYYTYYGFLYVQYVDNVKIEDCNLYALHTEHDQPDSTYDYIIEHATNITSTRVKIPQDQLTGNQWGVIATNYVKDIVFEDCRLNRIDSHRGVNNLTITNCEIGNKGLSLIGSGKLIITGTSVTEANQFVWLRGDYGSTWDGTIEIKNSTFNPPSNWEKILITMRATFDSDSSMLHHFGYDIVLPDVNITNLQINSSASQVYIYNNTDTGILNGNLSKVSNYIANNYTYANNSTFKYTIPKSIKYSGIKTNSGTPTIANYKISF